MYNIHYIPESSIISFYKSESDGYIFLVNSRLKRINISQYYFYSFYSFYRIIIRELVLGIGSLLFGFVYLFACMLADFFSHDYYSKIYVLYCES